MQAKVLSYAPVEGVKGYVTFRLSFTKVDDYTGLPVEVKTNVLYNGHVYAKLYLGKVCDVEIVKSEKLNKPVIIKMTPVKEG